ncbi:Triosephosphate isomerase [Zopfochytrium polystomum]|nr:Triosephosphate isomerase [Zopfochytrium polystomum]
MTARKFLVECVGGNWKMNGSKQLVSTIVSGLNAASWSENVEVVIAPPAPYLDLVRSTLRKDVGVAAQNIYSEKKGAYTGELSSEFLKDLSIGWTILGHSDRREIFKESDEFVAKKVAFAIREGLSVIACIGEKLEEREAGLTTQVVFRQLKAIADALTPAEWANVVVAYEPVWAIGTGKVATPAADVHKDIRRWLSENVSGEVAGATRILYGGSVNAKSAPDLQKEQDIDGFLVGGASLTSEFVTVIASRA